MAQKVIDFIRRPARRNRLVETMTQRALDGKDPVSSAIGIPLMAVPLLGGVALGFIYNESALLVGFGVSYIADRVLRLTVGNDKDADRALRNGIKGPRGASALVKRLERNGMAIDKLLNERASRGKASWQTMDLGRARYTSEAEAAAFRDGVLNERKLRSVTDIEADLSTAEASWMQAHTVIDSARMKRRSVGGAVVVPH